MNSNTPPPAPPSPRPGTTARYTIALVSFVALLLLTLKATRIETDFGAFLPPSTTAEQRLLITQLRDGLVSRLILVALQGADETTLAETSQALTEKLNQTPDFDYAANGSLTQPTSAQSPLLQHRYLLSPNITSEKFSAHTLREALQQQLTQLASPLGAFSRNLIPQDPTGEYLTLLQNLAPSAAPSLRQGVWFSQDGSRALLIVQTKAAGFDSVQQTQAIAQIRQLHQTLATPTQLILSGPGVFAAESHRLIERDATWLSLAATLVILALLITLYRSPLPVLLVATPVAFGLLAGILAVQTLFGSVHGITLGFAATLIGEAVDYPNYLLLNTAPHETTAHAAKRIRRTLILAVLTTVASATALTLSSFTGLSQLGVLTIIGIAVAGITTHTLIPWLLAGRTFPQRRISPINFTVGRQSLGITGLIATLAAAAWLAYTHPNWWEQNLANISPTPASLRKLDNELRQQLGAPEVSTLVASRGLSQAAALEAAETLTPLLQQWQQQNFIKSHDSPTRYLPSPATQQARQQALPDHATLQQNLQIALQGLPFRVGTFTPFLEAVAATRQAPPITLADYQGTPLGAKLSALILPFDQQWLVLTPLSGVSNPDRLQQNLPPGSQLIDLKQISSQMVSGYRAEAVQQTLWGIALILIILALGLGSPRRAVRIAAPAIAALLLTTTGLIALGQKISLFHIVALLLVLGVGLNYALFFERPPADENERQRTHLSLLICSLSTIATFGFLASSATPVLQAIGSTVALGAFISLLLSAAWAQAPPR